MGELPRGGENRIPLRRPKGRFFSGLQRLHPLSQAFFETAEADASRTPDHGGVAARFVEIDDEDRRRLFRQGRIGEDEPEIPCVLRQAVLRRCGRPEKIRILHEAAPQVDEPLGRGDVAAINRGEPPAAPTYILQASIASDNLPAPPPAPASDAPISADMLSAPIG